MKLKSIVVNKGWHHYLKEKTSEMKGYFKKNLTDVLYIIISLEIIIIMLFTKWSDDDIDKYISYLLQFSAIFSAIVLTVVISKIFSQRQENIKRKEEIEKLSNKVTDLRRIAKILIESNGLWPSKLQNIMGSEYSKLTHQIIETLRLPKDSPYEKIKLKYNADTRFNKTIGNLFIALRTLMGDVSERNLCLYSDYDFDYTYKFELINLWTVCHISNNLWYVFENEYCILNDQIHIDCISSTSQKEILHLASKIDKEKYSKYKSLTNKVLSNIGTDFESLYFKRLRRLLFENRPALPKTVSFTFNIMIIIMLVGALLPICFQITKFNNHLLLKFIFSIFIMTVSIFLIKFKKLLKEELIV